MSTLRLGVNVDHVATVRQARGTSYPDPVAAALAAERGGAGGITAHLREDRRHIQDNDILRLKEAISTKLNLEMAATAEMVAFACRVVPTDVCIVPEKRQELTTEGGLAAAGHERTLTPVIERLRDAGVRVSLFVDPDVRQIEAAAALKVPIVELHTGAYADAPTPQARDHELTRLRAGAAAAAAAGLQVNAGHGLTLDNVGAIAVIGDIVELNIGHGIVARSIFVGMEEAVREMVAACRTARGGGDRRVRG